MFTVRRDKEPFRVSAKRNGGCVVSAWTDRRRDRLDEFGSIGVEAVRELG